MSPSPYCGQRPAGASTLRPAPTSLSPPPVRNREFLSPHHRLTCRFDEERDGAGRCAGPGWTGVNMTACLAPAGLVEVGTDVVLWVGAFTVSVRDCSLASKVALPL